MALGLVTPGCNSADSREGQPGAPPIKDIPVINEPAFSYNFYEPKTEEGLKNDTNYGYLIAKARPGFKQAHFEKMGLKVVSSFAVNGGVYYRLYKDGGVLQALNEAKKYAGLIFMEPELIHELNAVETRPITFNNLDQYLLDKTAYAPYTIKAQDAWVKHGFGNPQNKPVVASVDTGVRWRHEDLAAQVRHAYSWYLPTGYTDYIWTDHVGLDVWEGGGIPLDAERLMNLLPDFTRPWGGSKYYSTDTNGHGTHTSGTMVATGNNGVGVAGVCWNNELISYKGFNSPSAPNAPIAGSDWSLYGSIWHLARWKEVNKYTSAIPVNFSLGGPRASRFALEMISHGLQNGIIVVAASGNTGQGQVMYPAAYAGVIAVGASTGADKLAKWSDWGSHLSVVAPGEDIISCLIYDDYNSVEARYPESNNTYYLASGTSMAAPHVTGLIGYMLNFNPGLKPDQIKTYIEQNADFIDGETGFSDKYGWGRINVLKTIEAVINDVNNNTTPPSNYAINPIKVKAPMNGLNVWLYNCRQDGAIENYVASAITGEYLTGYDPDTGQGRKENNIAWFNMLRPGWYVAKAYIGAANRVASTEIFEVAANMAARDVTLGFEAAMLTIQTLATADADVGAGKNICDPCIEVFDSAGNSLIFHDDYLWDEIMIPEPSVPGDYYIQITNFDGQNGGQANLNPGEYALWITNGAPYAPDDPNHYIIYEDGHITYIAPGTYASPLPPGGSAKSLHAQTMAYAQAVDMRFLYYARFNGEAAAGGTPGLTGHWYKFIVESAE